jgi:hypothetical protein
VGQSLIFLAKKIEMHTPNITTRMSSHLFTTALDECGFGVFNEYTFQISVDEDGAWSRVDYEYLNESFTIVSTYDGAIFDIDTPDDQLTDAEYEDALAFLIAEMLKHSRMFAKL